MPRLFGRAKPHDSGLPPEWLIVGLGNPGPEYARNRHNVGFWVLNRLAKIAAVDFARRGRLASLAEADLAGHAVILAKPQTYVNHSGDAVRELLRRYRLAPSMLLVVYDELDLPVGSLRIRERGSHGGQNGMRSIIAAVGTHEFPRVRIGIGHPTIDGERTREPEDVAAYVLADPPPDERQLLDAAVERAAQAVQAIIAGGVAGAMAQFNSGE